MWRVVALFALLSFGAHAQVVTVSSLVRPATFGSPSSTVAALPTCNSAMSGQIYTVTNALTPALGVAVVGGGAVSVIVRCNATNWLVGQ